MRHDAQREFSQKNQVFDDFDYKKKYEDEYYEGYIRQFEQNTKPRLLYRFVKRSVDIFVSLFGILLTFPLMIVIGIAIKCDSKGPIIFKQDRIGKDGKKFCCLKFRSMKTTAPSDCATSVLQNPEQHITKVGHFLRRCSLDELPQLFCCLIGTMSLIGYRPLVLTEEKCNDMRRRLGVFAMRPGISGYAQTMGRDEVYYKNKAILDAIYVKNASLGMDCRLLFKTVSVVLRMEGNHGKKTKK